eukprot:2532201-Prymnesium_polylepis.1
MEQNEMCGGMACVDADEPRYLSARREAPCPARLLRTTRGAPHAPQPPCLLACAQSRRAQPS